ncbi:MAG: MFS transporter [Clostridia bacterium]|nr:MFS transporter [Clostridia bacterium]
MEKSKRQSLLIALCWAVYVLSYVARYSYNANINPIISDYGIGQKSVVSTPQTLFFFAYGIGQVVNGFMCRRYNKRVVIPIALAVSGVCNFVPFVANDFSILNAIWLLNGVAQSFLWTSIIFSLSNSLDKERLPQATFIMSSTVALGTFLAYGLSALFTTMGAYRVIFLFASIGMAVMAILWFLSYNKLAIPRELAENEKEAQTSKSQRKTNITTGVFITVAMLAVFAVLNNLIKDGLSGWNATIFKECFGFGDNFAQITTIVLPVVGFIGQGINVKLQKKITNFVTLSGLWYTLTAVCLLGGTIATYYGLWLIVLICFALAFMFMLNVNNVITSMAPLYMRDSIPSGFMAGLMDGFCYVGSTISMIGLGSIADAFSVQYAGSPTTIWSSVLAVLVVLSAVAVVIAIAYIVISYLAKKNKRKVSSPVVCQKSKVKAIIFDLDGTLLNTLDDLHISVNIMLERNGFATRTYEEIRRFVGNGVAKLVERALPNGKDEKFDEYLAQFKSIYDEHKNDNTAPYEGIIDLLKRVKKEGYKSAIVSNKYDAAVQQLKNETFEGLIDFAVGEGNGIATKPAPDGVWLALEKLGVSKEQSVYVGDSEVDVLTAKNSGLDCIAVTWGFRDREILESEGARYIISAPDQLLPLLLSKDFLEKKQS